MRARTGRRPMPGVRLMNGLVSVLAIACLVMLGLLTWLGLGRRAEHRAEEHQRPAAPDGPLVVPLPGSRPAARLVSGPNHPDWPLPPRR
jgi:hypothetical protein